MAQSAILGLPYIQPDQAQKHVTHNEAIRILDAIAQIGVIDRNLTTPPVLPQDGDRYIVPDGATGDWAGQDNTIAVRFDSYWQFHTPVAGWVAWVADEDVLVAWSGTAWSVIAGAEVTGAPLFGVNTAADATNRLAVKSDAVLVSHDDVTPGTGDARILVNKQSAGQTGSVLFQSGWSGRAEFGLTGDDDWHVKVSADGATWHDAIVVDGSTGFVGLGTPPSTALDIAGPARVGQFTVASLPAASTAGAGAIAYVSDDTGGAVLAFSDGSTWRRVTDRAVVST